MSKITPQEILAADDGDGNEIDEAFADLIALSQPEYEPSESGDIPGLIAEVLGEGEIDNLEYEFEEGKISGSYQLDGKKYQFLLTKNNEGWSKEIVDANN